MKYIITALLFVGCGQVVAQDKLSVDSPLVTTIISSGWAIGFAEKGGVSVMMNQDSAFEIKGDSMAAIKLLWDLIHEGAQRESRAWEQYEKLYKAFEEIGNNIKQMQNYSTEIAPTTQAIKADLVVDTVMAPVVIKPITKSNRPIWYLIAGCIVVSAIVTYFIFRKNRPPATDQE